MLLSERWDQQQFAFCFRFNVIHQIDKTQEFTKLKALPSFYLNTLNLFTRIPFYKIVILIKSWMCICIMYKWQLRPESIFQHF